MPTPGAGTETVIPGTSDRSESPAKRETRCPLKLKEVSPDGTGISTLSPSVSTPATTSGTENEVHQDEEENDDAQQWVLLSASMDDCCTVTGKLPPKPGRTTGANERVLMLVFFFKICILSVSSGAGCSDCVWRACVGLVVCSQFSSASLFLVSRLHAAFLIQSSGFSTCFYHFLIQILLSGFICPPLWPILPSVSRLTY